MDAAVQKLDAPRPVSAGDSRGSAAGSGALPGVSHSVPNLGSSLSDLERCRGIAALEAMRSYVMSDAKKVLRSPDPPGCLGTPPLKGWIGMPPRVLRNCEKAMRIEGALSRMPEPLRSRLKAMPVEEWAGRDVWARPGSAPTGTHGKPLLRNALAKDGPECRPARPPPSRAVVTKACFVHLEKLVRMMWGVAPRADLPLLIARVVHGDPPVVPVGPVGDELKRMVPLPSALEAGGTWQYMEETMATQELAERLSKAGTESTRPGKAAAASGKDNNEDDFEGHRTTSGLTPAELVRCDEAQRLAAWRRHKGAVRGLRPLRGGPGPGAYCDRSLQRAVTDPRCGEFASSGNGRTKCTFTSFSQGTRFPGPPLPSERARRPKARKTQIAEEAPPQETLWQRLLGV